MFLFIFYFNFTYAQNDRIVKEQVDLLLTNEQQNTLKETYGELNYENSKMFEQGNEFLYYIKLNTKPDIVRRLVISKYIDKSKIISQIFIEEINDKDGNEIKPAGSIKNGSIKLISLNSGNTYQKDFIEGNEKYSESEDGYKLVDYKIELLDENGKVKGIPSESERISWGGCVKGCVGKIVRGWGVFEWTTCIIGAEYCLAGFGLGCGGYCAFFQ